MTSADRRTQALRHLEAIGLSLYEARAYLALLASPPVTGYELAKASRIPSSKIYETLQRLVAKGAALVSASEPPLYRAVPPEELIAGIRRQTERSLAALATTLPDLRVAPSVGIVWRLKDFAAILWQMEQLITASSQVVYLSIWPPEAAQLVDSVARARQRGIRFWIASFGASPLQGKGVYNLLACGASSAARLGRRLTAAVADDRHVLIAEFSDDGEPAGTLADDPALALAAKEYIIHDLVNHALIEELGQDRFAALRQHHPLVAGLLGPAARPRSPQKQKGGT